MTSAAISDRTTRGAALVRPARTADVRTIKAIVDAYAGTALLPKAADALYGDVQEFVVAEVDSRVVGCAGLHVHTEHFGELRTVAVLPDTTGLGVGGALVSTLVDRARDLGLTHLVVMTFQTEFFARHGFESVEGTPVAADIKPNTLGNTRMLLTLT